VSSIKGYFLLPLKALNKSTNSQGIVLCYRYYIEEIGKQLSGKVVGKN
jgi:hypothetical protein